MNSPTHLLLSSAVFSRSRYREYWGMAVLGAVLPDLPMFGFYAWYKLQGTAEGLIWGQLYFLPQWQNFFDIFNSIPLAALLVLAAHYLKRPALMVLGLSVLLHLAFDLPLHNDDAHRHFYPLFDWRFISPLSYWDARHYGDVIRYFELALCLLCLWPLLWRQQQRAWRLVGWFGAVALLIQVGIVVYWSYLFG